MYVLILILRMHSPPEHELLTAHQRLHSYVNNVLPWAAGCTLGIFTPYYTVAKWNVCACVHVCVSVV